jgi:hypothetical protein
VKNTTNGATPRAAKTTPALQIVKRSKGIESVLAADRREREAFYAANEAEFLSATKQLTIKIGLSEYGLLCSGAAHHDTTVEELISAWLDETVCDWSNNYFALE